MGELESAASSSQETIVFAGADTRREMSVDDLVAIEELPFDIPRD